MWQRLSEMLGKHTDDSRHSVWRLSALATSLCAALACWPTLVSCGANSCEQTREAYCIAEFSSTTGATISAVNVWGIGQQGTYVETLADTVTTWDDDGNVYDTIIYTRIYTDDLMCSAASAESLELILNPEADSTMLRLQITATVGSTTRQTNDTLTIRYTAYPFLIDMECGCTVRFDIHEASTTNHLLQGVDIRRSDISNDQHVNLVITY